MIKRAAIISTYILSLTSMTQIASAATPAWLVRSTIKGFIASYDWTSVNNQFSKYNQYTLTEGGGLFLGTPTYDGFSVAVEPLVQSGLGLHASNPNHVSRTLGPSVTALGQAYIKYHNYGTTFKVGNFELKNTPWNSSAMGIRLLPMTFQGVHIKTSPMTGLTFYATRIFRFRYVNQSQYNRGTVYSTYKPSILDRASSGFLSVGAAYNGMVLGDPGIKSNDSLWFWNYYQYARLYLAQSINSVEMGSIKGLFGVQLMHAGKKNGYLGSVNAQLYGGELGMAYKPIKVMFTYDYLPAHPGTFNYGGLVTPYNSITDSGPLFSQPITDSTEDFGSGSAYGVHFDYTGIKNLFTQLRFIYLHMRTSPIYSNFREVSLITSYKFSHIQGLRVTNIANFATKLPGTNLPNFFQNRLMLIYNF